LSSTKTQLVRICFSCDVVKDIDQFAAQIHVEGRRKIPRAALIRAMITCGLTAVHERRLLTALGADRVRSGRARKRRVARKQKQ
jgi:hypothetical protein